jgi:membrane protein DedA with SNARE-associated domain
VRQLGEAGTGDFSASHSLVQPQMTVLLHYLLDLIGGLGHWSYLILFVAAALECAAFLGLLIPGESLMLASGFFAQHGVLDVELVTLVGILGAIVGDNIGYQLGCRLGREWLLRHGARFGLRPRRLEKAEAFFARHGAKAVFLGRFIGFARALVPFLAGASKMPYRSFLLYNAVGAVLWGLAFTVLGYSLGASWHIAERWISRAGMAVGVLCLVVLLAFWLRRRHGRAEPR